MLAVISPAQFKSGDTKWCALVAGRSRHWRHWASCLCGGRRETAAKL